MSWPQMLAWVSAVAYGCLYLSGVTVIGFITHNEVAWKIALVAAGLCFLTFAMQVVEPDWKLVNWRIVAGTSAACSIVAGVVAGAALLIR